MPELKLRSRKEKTFEHGPYKRRSRQDAGATKNRPEGRPLQTRAFHVLISATGCGGIGCAAGQVGHYKSETESRPQNISIYFNELQVAGGGTRESPVRDRRSLPPSHCAHNPLVQQSHCCWLPAVRGTLGFDQRAEQAPPLQGRKHSTAPRCLIPRADKGWGKLPENGQPNSIASGPWVSQAGQKG